MDKVTRLNCVACGAPISVPDDLDFLNCQSCGSFLAIERGEGYVALKIAEKLVRAIEDSGKDTQRVIQEGTTVTRNELQRLQLSQELGQLKTQLANTQAEIRTLTRSASSSTIVRQLADLHGDEAQKMGQIRQIDSQLSRPLETDLPGLIRFYEYEISRIRQEIEAVQLSSLPDKKQVTADRNNEISQLSEKVFLLKLKVLKSKLSSYDVAQVPDDLQGVTDLLALIDKDHKYLGSLPHSPEGAVLQKELSGRYEEVYKRWQALEQRRIDGKMVSLSYARTGEDESSLRRYLVALDQDVAMLHNDPSNPVIQTNLTRLALEREKVEKQIRSIENEARKAARQAAKAARGNAESPGAVYAPAPTSPGSAKAIGVGCLLAALALLVSSGLGLLAAGLLSGLFENKNLTASFFFLFFLVGFLAAARIFTMRVLPGATVQFPLLPPIRIAPEKEPKLTHQGAGKAILAGIAGLFLWAIGLTIAMFLSAFELANAPAYILFIFFPLGIALAVFVFARASISFTGQRVE